MEFTVRLTAAIAMLASEKLRSRNRLSGTRGSAGVNRCHTTNATSTASPVPMSSHTVTGPTTVPQL